MPLSGRCGRGSPTRKESRIFGASYGGYAALVGLTVTPEVFACGVDIVGPSNLITLLESIPPYWKSFFEDMAHRVGDPRTAAGRAGLTRRSPLTHVERIKRPLLIAQGANDPRVKQAESDQIAAAMQAKNLPVTYVIYPDEGHGFARAQNRLSFYAVAEAFLAQHLGGHFEPIGADFNDSSLQIAAGAEFVPGIARGRKPGVLGDDRITAVQPARDISTYRKFWAARFGTAPFLPTSRAEMDALGWDSCDIILVTGDAYVDHPSFGMGVIGRALEAQGFRVGIIAQPDWHGTASFEALGRPNLFFGVTSGNMDSMVNRYTAERRVRSDDAYTPGGVGGKRPDRAVIVYAQRVREAFKDVPIVVGGIEASLRRIAHFDYWSEKVRRSILLDAKADLLVYGNAERQVCELAHRLAAGEAYR